MIIKKEDMDFLKNLQHEMLTQDHVSQASPRFWAVMQTVKDYWVEDDIDGVCIYDTYASESVFEGEIEELVDWISTEFDVVMECECNNGLLKIICEDENEYCISDISEIKSFLEEYDYGRFSICNYRNRAEIVPNTFFLTLKECKKHIKNNIHHYNKTAHAYAMTAWRSQEVARLYEILENTDWEI